MSDEVGTAHIGIVADTTQFKADLVALKASAKKLGGSVGESFIGTFAKRVNRGMKKFLRQYSGDMALLVGLTKVTANAIATQFKRMTRAVQGFVAKGLGTLKAASKKAWASVRDHASVASGFVSVAFMLMEDAAREYITRGLAPLVAAWRRATSPIIRSAAKIALSVNAFKTQMTAALQQAAGSVSSLVRRINNRIRDVLDKSGVTAVVANARDFGRSVSTAVGEGFSVGMKTARNIVRLGMDQFGDRVKRPLKTLASQVSFHTQFLALRLQEVVDNKVLNGVRARMQLFKRAIIKGIPETEVGRRMLQLKKSLRDFIDMSAVAKFSFAMKKLKTAALFATRSITNSFQRMSRAVNRSLRRMDSTVRLVILAIAFAAQPLAALSAGMSAAAAAGAVAALAPLAALMVPLALGIAAAVAGFKDLKTYAPEAATALGGLKTQFKDVAVPALMKEWGDSLGGFFDSLKGFLSADIFSGIGKAFAGITESITEVLSGDVGSAFKTALAGPITDALGTMGQALGPLLSTLLEFMTAAAPYAVILADMFLAWAENLQKAFAENVADGSFQEFMDKAIVALQVVFDLFGAIGDVISTVFSAGIGPGTQFLQLITDLIAQFATWLQGDVGQAALKSFFDGILTIMPPLLGLVGALGTGLADLVTPEIMSQTAGLLTALAGIIPVLVDLLNIVGEAGVLDLLAAAIASIGDVIEPLIEPAKEFLSVFSGVLLQALEALTPTFTLLGEVIGSLFTALAPLLPILGDLLVTALMALVPLIAQLLEAFAPLIEAVLPLLVPMFQSLVPALSQIIGAVIQVVAALMPFVTLLLETLMPFMPALIDIISALAAIIGDTLVSVLDLIIPILNLFVPILASILPIVELLLPVIELLGVLLDVFLTVVLAILDPILDWMSNTTIITDGIKKLSDVISGAIDWVNGIIDAIKDWMDNDLAKWAEDAWAAIEETFTSMLDWFGELPEKIGGFFTDIGDGIKDAFQSAFNFVADAWNNTIGQLSWSVPSWVPGLGGKTISAPKLPKFAAGTIATSATMGIFGEAGAEALVPLNRPLNMVDPSVRGLSAIAQGLAVPGAGTNISEGAIVINTPSTNGRAIAESVLDRIVAYSR
jgi:phage-related protein